MSKSYFKNYDHNNIMPEAEIAQLTNHKLQPMVAKELENCFNTDDIINKIKNEKLTGLQIRQLIQKFVKLHKNDIDTVIDTELQQQLGKKTIIHDYTQENNKKIKDLQINKMNQDLIDFYIAKSIALCLVDSSLDATYKNTLFEYGTISGSQNYMGLIQDLISSGQLTTEQNDYLIDLLIYKKEFVRLCRLIDTGKIPPYHIVSFAEAVLKDKHICLPGNFALPEIGDLLISKKIQGPSYTKLIIAIAQTEDDAMIQDLIASDQISGKDLRILQNAFLSILKKEEEQEESDDDENFDDKNHEEYDPEDDDIDKKHKKRKR